MKIFMAMPTYDLTVHLHAARAFYVGATTYLPRFYAEAGRSLLANCFNILWGAALSIRKDEGITHFAMLHSDVVPQDGWLDILYQEMTRTQSHLVSVVLPIKDLSGVTSTAIGGETYQPVRRLTMKEVLQLPETFTATDCGYPNKPLWTNTGCWLVDLSLQGIDRAAFEIRDSIKKTPEGYQPVCFPEDWSFADQVHELGGRVSATRKVSATHVGTFAYSNQAKYGYEHDPVSDGKPLPVFGG